MNSDVVNVRVAWWMIGLGMLSGAVLGTWSFGGPIPAPEGFVAYDDLPRRMLRLAHIAMIALPILNLELVRSLGLVRLPETAQQRAARAMLIGTVALPALLAIAAYWRPALYLLPIPVCALMVGAFSVALGLTPTASGSEP